MTDEQMLKEIVERRRQWGETRDSDFEWLIKQAEKMKFNLYSDFVNRINELEKEIEYLREANSINAYVNTSMSEKIKTYEQAHKDLKQFLKDEIKRQENNWGTDDHSMTVQMILDKIEEESK